MNEPVRGKGFIVSIGAKYELNVTPSLKENEIKLKKILKQRDLIFLNFAQLGIGPVH
ncbi:hypothetical protein YDYSG_58800 [Paenibacillus tyrfis]|nr:hypothetical protein YDYSG_58800 [Paenibacillus tyrfis]GMX61030.1 hypothetical protein Elgi_74260 [Paenibacillus elgii]